MEKPTLIYVYDAICSWCYAIEKEVKQVIEHYGDQLDYQIVSGGMFIGENKAKFNTVFPSGNFRNGYQRVIDYGGVSITENYFGGLIEKENYELNSEKPAAAFSVFKLQHPNDALAHINFITTLQQQIYIDGKNPNSDEFYEELAPKVGMDAKTFLEQMIEEKYVKDSFDDFKFSRELGVNSYPQVFLKTPADEYYQIVKGYNTASELTRVIESIVK